MITHFLLKGTENLIESIRIRAKLMEKRIQASTSAYGREAFQQSEGLCPGDGVQILGPQRHGRMMGRQAGTVDVFVHPSFKGIFCIAAAETMAMEISVISGLRSGTVTWVLDYGEAGLLVDVTSHVAIAQGMRAMLQNNAIRRTLIQAGRERALKEFHLEAVAKKYESVLENARQEQTR